MIHRRIFVGLALFLASWSFSTSLRAEDTAAKPALPKVLILGDSISLGYTEPVRKLLEGKAEVRRPNENCQHTGHGLKRIDAWLGTEKWDVIHFNWGIWDTHFLDANGALVRDEAGAKGPLKLRHTPEQYRENLTALVEKMQATGATLVWASTTPIMRRTGERFELVPRLNSVAAELMQSRKIASDDLYTLVLPNAKEWQTSDKVHFSAAGNAKLAEQVSASILEALKARAGK